MQFIKSINIFTNLEATFELFQPAHVEALSTSERASRVKIPVGIGNLREMFFFNEHELIDD